MGVLYAARRGHGVLTVTGALDATTISVLEREVLTVLNAGSVHVIVDLTGVLSCDAAAVSGLRRGCTACAALGGSLRVAGAAPLVAESFSRVGIGAQIPVYADVAAAVEHHERRWIGHPAVLPPAAG